MCLCLVIRRLADWLGKHLDKMEVGDADRLALCTVIIIIIILASMEGRVGRGRAGIDLLSQVRGGGGGGGGISNIENNVL